MKDLSVLMTVWLVHMAANRAEMHADAVYYMTSLLAVLQSSISTKCNVRGYEAHSIAAFSHRDPRSGFDREHTVFL